MLFNQTYNAAIEGSELVLYKQNIEKGRFDCNDVSEATPPDHFSKLGVSVRLVFNGKPLNWPNEFVVSDEEKIIFIPLNSIVEVDAILNHILNKQWARFYDKQKPLKDDQWNEKIIDEFGKTKVEALLLNSCLMYFKIEYETEDLNIRGWWRFNDGIYLFKDFEHGKTERAYSASKVERQYVGDIPAEIISDVIKFKNFNDTTLEQIKNILMSYTVEEKLHP